MYRLLTDYHGSLVSFKGVCSHCVKGIPYCNQVEVCSSSSGDFLLQACTSVGDISYCMHDFVQNDKLDNNVLCICVLHHV